MAYVYRHIRLDKNVPFYIGMSKNDDDYYRAHTRHSRHAHWKNIVAKTEYEVEILIDGVSFEEAIKTEMYFIKLYGRYDLKAGTLCNRTDGGEGTKNPSEDFRRKISESKKGNTYMKGRPVSAETRRKISVANGGTNSAWYGKKHTAETRHKISKKNLGRVKPEEECRKISAAMMGNIPYNKGVKMDEKRYEIHLKTAEKLMTQVAKYDLNGDLICVYQSVIKAAKDNSLGQGNITNASNKQIMYGNFIWRYVIDEVKEKIDSYDLRIKPVIQTTIDGEFVAEYESAMEAARKNGWVKSTILRASKRNNNIAYNFKWHKK